MPTNISKKEEVTLSENARIVLKKRYLKRDEKGNVMETPVDMFRRVARNIALADKFYNKNADLKKTEEVFYAIMSNLEFLPNSPTLMNAGRDLQQLSACFVLPIEDSMESIFETIKDTALIHKSGGGTGFSFSRLRPKNSTVRSTGGISSGPVSFMKVFNAATQAVKQGGTRRGANMGILRIDHPDILEFITCKENDKEIANFNISIGITEDFIKKVEANKEYDLIDPHTKMVRGTLNAREVFDLIIKMAHKNGEPGIIFLDRLNKDNPTPKLGEIESTNPCGEQPLLPYESCNLGSINLSKMVKRGKIDWQKLNGVTRAAVHFLDNVIDVNRYPLKKIEKMTKANRKIGLGVMGFADMLIKLGVPYNSEEAIKIGEEVMKSILDEAKRASVELAKERGAFPNFKDSIYNISGAPVMRNATLTTIAPTGTLSIIADCSSGIEPLFALAYYRNVLDNDKLMEVNNLFKEQLEQKGFYSEALMKKIIEKGSITDIEEIPLEIRKIFVTSHDIAPEWHVRMQAAFQKFTNNAVSKTINFPQEATFKDVEKAYMLAYRLGCKGITIYRDKSRNGQVLNIGDASLKEVKEEGQTQKISPRPRPTVTKGTTTKVGTGCGNLYVTINEDDKGMPFEVFTQMGKAGGCAASQLEAIARLVSLALRSGIEINAIIEQLRGIRCPSPSWEKGGRIFSCADAIARVIELRLTKQEKDTTPPPSSNKPPSLPQAKRASSNIVGVCPDCGSALRHEEGCMTCRACGYSKC
ncbi:MAG: vitamin B12-dependent ribonucleotide reductase [Candidatus Omnitrophica bacterium]|nr:vitamin B12-dependent ribonucleotide reductase [Candidatus Omnitrophota bacterium]